MPTRMFQLGPGDAVYYRLVARLGSGRARLTLAVERPDEDVASELEICVKDERGRGLPAVTPARVPIDRGLPAVAREVERQLEDLFPAREPIEFELAPLCASRAVPPRPAASDANGGPGASRHGSPSGGGLVRGSKTSL